MSNQQFDDAEVKKILARAAEQQQEAERRGLASGGTSMTDLQEIAKEVGLDPRYIASAAEEVALGRTGESPGRFLGVARRIGRHRVIPSEISLERWGQIVSELRATFGVNGVTSDFGSVREWTTSTNPHESMMPVRVRLNRTEGGTAISIEQDTGQASLLPALLGASIGSVAIILAMVAFFAGVNGPLTALTSVFGGIGAIIFGGGIAIGSRFVQRQEGRIDAAMDRIELIARSDQSE